VVRDAEVKDPVGADVSITTDRELDVADVQLPDERVQVTLVDPAFAAVITPVPESVPETANVGVLSLVKLSVEDVPKSEESDRFGVDGVATVVLISTVETPEVFPAASFTTT
jgi:hypothetical protein